jgi:hypothetical protein
MDTEIKKKNVEKVLWLKTLDNPEKYLHQNLNFCESNITNCRICVDNVGNTTNWKNRFEKRKTDL